MFVNKIYLLNIENLSFNINFFHGDTKKTPGLRRGDEGPIFVFGRTQSSSKSPSLN
jgi:hypothetical protein